MNKHYLTLIALSLVLLPVTTEAQRIPETHFSIVVAAGAGWDGGKTWTFESCDCAPINPGMSIGVGLEYGPLIRVGGALVMPSIEISFGEERASQSFPTGTIRAGVQRMPIMFWTKVIAETNLSPFLRVGAGLARTDFREDASARNGATIRFHEWGFSWGAGAGLNYQLTGGISAELFVDYWSSEKPILGVNSSGNPDGISHRYALQAFGIRGLFSL